MKKEIEETVLELLETIGEALEYLQKTDSLQVTESVAESRRCVEEILNDLIQDPISNRIDAENLSDAEWLLTMYRVMDVIKQPVLIQNQYDREFFSLLDYIWKNSKIKLVGNMKNCLWELRKRSETIYDGFIEYFSKYPFWGTIHPQQGDYQTLELRARVLKQKSYEFLWLYRRFEDYLSKRTLCAILKNWAFLDINDLAKVKSIFPDYYEPDIFPDNHNDIFVDIGAFNGDSILQYIHMYGTDYKKIYAYEISPNTFSELEKNLAGCHDIITRQKGAGASGGVFLYLEEGNDASANQLKHTKTSQNKVEVVSLDEDITEPVTFIKMDIEGAEQDALLGLQKTIRQYHPKLAICTYHGYEDIWKIPFIIDSICPDYKFYLRHYGGNLIPTEFVLLCSYEETS